MTVYGIAVDSQDNIYIPNVNTIRKVAPQFFIDRYSADGGDISFAEENNLNHIMSSSGQHIQTVDTGATLHEFEYDADNRLISITDEPVRKHFYQSGCCRCTNIRCFLMALPP